jgi:hypothetical protein
MLRARAVRKLNFVIRGGIGSALAPSESMIRMRRASYPSIGMQDFLVPEPTIYTSRHVLIPALACEARLGCSDRKAYRHLAASSGKVARYETGVLLAARVRERGLIVRNLVMKNNECETKVTKPAEQASCGLSFCTTADDGG